MDLRELRTTGSRRLRLTTRRRVNYLLNEVTNVPLLACYDHTCVTRHTLVRYDFDMQIQIAFLRPEFIEGAYAHARAFMVNGNDSGPTVSDGIDAEEDIARGHCFLVADDEGPCCLSFISGLTRSTPRSMALGALIADHHIIHRVAAVRGRSRSGDLASRLPSPDYLRCDTHKDNALMRRALEAFGFRECERTITVANGMERVVYDWLKSH